MSPGSREVLLQYIKKTEDGHQSECTMCGQQNALRSNILNHVESVHFPGTFLYDCTVCGQQFSSKNSLNVHVSRKHKSVKHQDGHLIAYR